MTRHPFLSPENDWCSFDSGLNPITDNLDQTHRVYASRTRDGSVWVRAGADYSTMTWGHRDQPQLLAQTQLLDDVTVDLLRQLPNVYQARRAFRHFSRGAGNTSGFDMQLCVVL